MRIKCPECELVLSIGQPKPGSYRPKCKHCGKPFRLKITDDDPPKVGIGPIRAATAKPNANNPTSTSSQERPQSPEVVKPSLDPDRSPEAVSTSSAGESGDVEATMDSVPGMDATMDGAEKADATMDEASGIDATMDSAHCDATQGANVDATVDTSSAASQTSVRKGASARGMRDAEKTSGHADATMDGTVDGSSQVSVKSPSGAGKSKALVSAGGSAAKSRQVTKQSSADDSGEIPDRLGGYRILRLLGRGAMGAVYEAKQVSLDRLVALKTIRGRLANNPASLARFTREAYAAAQLTHHNVVQIYDFGEDAGRHFFSMEWVRGGPLDELIREKGALDPRLAAGYVLQAARGLQFAHRNGMVHRDVKPANLLLSDEGVVKVADLGLVKIPDQMDSDSDLGGSSMSGLESGTQVTMQGTAVGTPAYMAPEQGIDAAGVDHRADIYSLGCTLFYLLAGRPPFEGSVVSEVLEQHAKRPLPDLIAINARVPQSLQDVTERSMAKRPEDRYASLSEMVLDLEAFLGVGAEGKFSPTSEQADKWEQIAAHYTASAPLLRLSKPVLAGFVCLGALLTLAGPLLGLSWILLGPAFLVTAIVTSVALGAQGGPSAVVTSFRGWIGSLSWVDYGVGLLGAVVFLLVAFVAGMWPGVIVGGLLGAAAGAAYHFVIIAPSRRNRQPVLEDAERFIRDLRIDGADEEGVRAFAARYAGKQWQEIFEALFGYDSLCTMRAQLQSDPSFSASTASDSWRDKACASLAAKSKANLQTRDHKRLAAIEQRGLQSEGLSAGDARERAWQMAAAVMDNAKAVAPDVDAGSADAAAEAKRQQMKTMLAEARSGKYKKRRDRLAPIRFALGGQTRLLAGCVLLAIFAIWGNNNGLFDSFKDLELTGMDLDQMGAAVRDNVAAANEAGDGTALGGNASPWSVGLAGVLLAMSAFVSGWRMTPFAVVATVVILLGPSLGIPGISHYVTPWMVSGLAGLAIYIPGIMFGEN